MNCGEVSYFFDGEKYRDINFGGTTVQNSATGGLAGVNDTRLEEGTTHTLTAETTAVQSGDHIVDVMFAYDDRSQFDITSPSNSAFSGDTYDFPELFPDSVSVSFPEFNSRRSLTEIELFQSWNDTSNNTSVTLTLGSQSQTVSNPSLSGGNIRETLTVSQSNSSRTGSIDITLSRFNDTSTSSDVPRLGDAAQRMSFHNVDGNPDAVTRSNIGEATTRAFFRSGLLTGNTLRESGQKAAADLLTHSIFADVDPDNDNIIASEQIQFIPK
jgi:hypothetical protein